MMRLDLFWMTRDLFDESEGDVGFGQFTVGHFLWLAATLLLIVGIVRLYGRGGERRRDDMRKMIALVLILSEIMKVCVIALTGAPNRYYLPLEICSLAEYAILFDAFWPHRKLPGWLLAYSLAPAAILALLFPTAANYPVIHFFTIHQFMFHALIAAYFIMRFHAGEIDVGYGGLWAEIGVLVILVAAIYCLDAATGTNYMFLMDTEGNPALSVFWDMTGGQGGFSYLFSLTAIAIVLAHLMYVFYRLRRRGRSFLRLKNMKGEFTMIKKLSGIISVLLAAVLLMAPAALAADDGLFASDQDIIASPDWVAELSAAQDESVTQLFIVAGFGMDKTTATVSMHERGEDGVWRQVLSTPGFVGKYGLVLDKERREGCGKTPIGVYHFNKAFGIAEDPGCAIPYVQVDDDIWWSGDSRDGMHYNEMVDIKEYPDLDLTDSEHIVDYSYEYQYCLNISFNEDGTPGRGSAIFLHCFGTVKPYTGGCVALPEYIIKQVMQRVQPDCVVVIDTYKSLTGCEYVGDEPSFIDYLALVNKLNPLPDGWEDALETVTTTNSVGDEVEVEKKAYDAYLGLKADLEENDGIYIELDSARRSVAAQQEIMDRFIEKYGADYAAKTVAQPGYSEHHTGLALDLYFRIKNEDGSFTDVYYNEDMEKDEYRDIWAAIHSKLADYGFILRYLEDEEHITGYRYEPWHIRYVDSVDIAQEIMSEPGLTLEEYLAGQDAPEVAINLSGSELYTNEELYDAMLAIKCQFAAWDGCELHAIRYAGDETASEENLAWLNSLAEDSEYVQVVELRMDFHTAKDIQGAWEPDHEYTDYQWWLARIADGGWEIVSEGY